MSDAADRFARDLAPWGVRVALGLAGLSMLTAVGLSAAAIAPRSFGLGETTEVVPRQAIDPQASLAGLIDRQTREAGAGPSAAVLTTIASRIDAAVDTIETASRGRGGLLDAPRGAMLIGAGMLLLLALIGLVAALAIRRWGEAPAAGSGPDHGAVSGMGATLSAQLAACAGLLERLRTDTIDSVEHATATGTRLRASATDAETRIATGLTRALDILSQSSHAAQSQPGSVGEMGEAVRLSTDTALRTSRQIERVEKVLMGLLETLQRQPQQDEAGHLAMLDQLGALAARLEAAVSDNAGQHDALADVSRTLAANAETLPSIVGRLSQIHTVLESAAIRVEDDIQRVATSQAAALEQAAGRIATETGGACARFDEVAGVLTAAGAEMRMAATALEAAGTGALQTAQVGVERIEAQEAAAAGLDQSLRGLSRGLETTVSKAQLATESMASLPVFLEQAKNALVDFTLDWTSRCETVLGRLETLEGASQAGSGAAEAVAALQNASVSVIGQIAEFATRLDTQCAALDTTRLGLETISRDLVASHSHSQTAAAEAVEALQSAGVSVIGQIAESATMMGARGAALDASRLGIEAISRDLVASQRGSQTVAAEAVAALQNAAVSVIGQIADSATRLDTQGAALDTTRLGLETISRDLVASHRGSQTAATEAVAALKSAGVSVIGQIAESATRLDTQGAALDTTRLGLATISRDLAESNRRSQSAAERSEAVLVGLAPLDAMARQARDAMAAWISRSHAVMERLEAIPPATDSGAAIAAAVAEIRAAGGDALRPLLAAAHGMDRHAEALVGVNQGLTRLTSTLARSEERALAVSTRTEQMVGGLDRLPPLLDASHRSLTDWAQRCETLLARLEASQDVPLATAVVEPADDRSIATRLLASLTPDDAADLEVTQALRRLGGVETEVGYLLRDAEGLAEKVMVGTAPVLPQAVSAETPALLAGLHETIARLQSVATALAMAADGPAVRPAVGSVANTVRERAA